LSDKLPHFRTIIGMFASPSSLKLVRLLWLAILVALPMPVAFAATNAVEVLRTDWLDAARHRNMPVKIYYPQAGTGLLPVIIFSHGLGGSRDGYEYLGRYWAAHGYVSVHLQHLGSDAAVWQDQPVAELKSRLRQSAANLDNAANRPADVSFAIDRLEKLNLETSPLKNRLDLARLGVAGHSFGAFTTLAVAGQVFIAPGDREISYGDPRIKAAVAMSAPVPARKNTLDRAFGKIKIPILHLTGTEDSSPIGETHPSERRVPFDHIHGADQYLLTLNGGDHMIFGGVSSTLPLAQQTRFKELICASATAFWDAYLKGEASAKTWLTKDFPTVLATNGMFEIKLGK
jgi:predicted dienelactone hydrolase